MLGQLVLSSMPILDESPWVSPILPRNCWIAETISLSSAGFEDVILMIIGFGLDGRSKPSIHDKYWDKG